MAARLKVDLKQGKPGSADVKLRLEVDGARYETLVDHVVFEPLWKLCDALAALIQVGPPVEVTWLYERPQGVLRIEHERDDQLRLSILTYRSPSRTIGASPDVDFEFRGTRDEIVVPFWRALRRLESVWAPEGSAFPSRELAAVTRLVRASGPAS